MRHGTTAPPSPPNGPTFVDALDPSAKPPNLPKAAADLWDYLVALPMAEHWTQSDAPAVAALATILHEQRHMPTAALAAQSVAMFDRLGLTPHGRRRLGRNETTQPEAEADPEPAPPLDARAERRAELIRLSEAI